LAVLAGIANFSLWTHRRSGCYPSLDSWLHLKAGVPKQGNFRIWGRDWDHWLADWNCWILVFWQI